VLVLKIGKGDNSFTTGNYLNISLLVTSSVCGLFGIYESFSK
jgi:hypothetical protein